MQRLDDDEQAASTAASSEDDHDLKTQGLGLASEEEEKEGEEVIEEEDLLEAQLEQPEKAKPKKDFMRLKALKAELAEQIAYDEERAVVEAALAAAEESEDYDQCHQLQIQLEEMKSPREQRGAAAAAEEQAPVAVVSVWGVAGGLVDACRRWWQRSCVF